MRLACTRSLDSLHGGQFILAMTLSRFARSPNSDTEQTVYCAKSTLNANGEWWKSEMRNELRQLELSVTYSSARGSIENVHIDRKSSCCYE